MFQAEELSLYLVSTDAMTSQEAIYISYEKGYEE